MAPKLAPTVVHNVFQRPYSTYSARKSNLQSSKLLEERFRALTRMNALRSQGIRNFQQRNLPESSNEKLKKATINPQQSIQYLVSKSFQEYSGIQDQLFNQLYTMFDRLRQDMDNVRKRLKNLEHVNFKLKQQIVEQYGARQIKTTWRTNAKMAAEALAELEMLKMQITEMNKEKKVDETSEERIEREYLAQFEQIGGKGDDDGGK